MSKQPKPAKRRASAGENIAKLIDPEGTITAELWRRRISGKIDRAIRAAVRKRDVRWMDAMVLQGLSPNIMNGVFRRLQEIDP